MTITPPASQSIRSHPRLEVALAPCLSDNYAFLAHDPETGETVAVDTPDAATVLGLAVRLGWRITRVWNTHHHPDHVGGNAAVAAATGARVWANAADRHRIPGVTDVFAPGDRLALGALSAEVIDTPGHTRGHVAFHLAEAGVVFVGDTLFALGCGRLFEGAPEEMWASLSRLAGLPAETAVYCAHEYTAANARFALTLERENPALRNRAEEVAALRAAGRPTVPTTIGAELATNPFLRPQSAAIRKTLGLTSELSDVAVFAAIRAAKDSFR